MYFAFASTLGNAFKTSLQNHCLYLFVWFHFSKSFFFFDTNNMSVTQKQGPG